MSQDTETLETLLQQRDKILSDLWHSACIFVATIEDFQPDFILALYHSVQGVLCATETLWDVTYSGIPFPPVVRSNLGREKTARFEDFRTRSGYGYPYIDWLCIPGETAHYLAWLAHQESWLVELATQVQAVWHSDHAPARILILDDFIHEGATWVMALGLLLQLYPSADIWALGGPYVGWKQVLGEFWLAEQAPEVYARIVDDRTSLVRDLAQLAVGTENVDPELLAWRSITADSPVVQRLSVYLPAERWLALAPWVYTTIERYMRERPVEAFAQGLAEARANTYYAPHRLSPLERVLREAWLGQSLTRGEVVRLAGLSSSQATRLLLKAVKRQCLARNGHGRGTHYSIAHNYGVLAYGSLLTDPGVELAEVIAERRSTITPFTVEYACSNQEYAGAPFLAPVPAQFGTTVNAQILVTHPDIQDREVRDRLYRREVNRVGDEDCEYDGRPEQIKSNAVVIEAVQDLAGVPTVFYTALKPNIPEILRADLSAKVKAKQLAELALASVTLETYTTECDGIHYLIDAMQQGITTPLSALYRDAVLRLANNAPNLEMARQWAARRQGFLDG